METFFDDAVGHCLTTHEGAQVAKRLARKYGLGAMDALHIQSAIALGAEEFVTGESKRVLTRVTELRVTQIGISRSGS